MRAWYLDYLRSAAAEGDSEALTLELLSLHSRQYRIRLSLFTQREHACTQDALQITLRVHVSTRSSAPLGVQCHFKFTLPSHYWPTSVLVSNPCCPPPQALHWPSNPLQHLATGPLGTGQRVTVQANIRKHESVCVWEECGALFSRTIQELFCPRQWWTKRWENYIIWWWKAQIVQYLNW